MGTKPLVWLDLCSGLGGASQPALDRGWKVIRVDNDPKFETGDDGERCVFINSDICKVESTLWLIRTAMRMLQTERITVIWASSVCTEFTKWGLPDSWVCNRGGKKTPDLTLSLGCKAIIDAFPDADWVFENVATSRLFLTPILGPVRAMVNGHTFWGNFPGLLPQTKGHKWKLPPSPDRAALRAKIPYEIGEAICRAVEARQ